MDKLLNRPNVVDQLMVLLQMQMQYIGFVAHLENREELTTSLLMWVPEINKIICPICAQHNWELSNDIKKLSEHKKELGIFAFISSIELKCQHCYFQFPDHMRMV